MDYAPTTLMLSVGLERETPSLHIVLLILLKYWLLQYEMMKSLRGVK